ncbi:PLAC8 motif-containing protein [Trema orientale]|uniref:PLAC8 motif-containing protein n=1 Tax=Trema orientale TaxID=63057 RepID=A0A2P5FAI8_TREOI|nr:PLAC8 motif-containing protein [Trema orientale]
MNIDHRHSLQQPSWSSGLCGCGDHDPGNCCMTCVLPCITFGRIAEVVDEGQTSCVAHGLVYGLLMLIECHWLYSCVYRERIRKKFGLPETPCCDCCVHFCCEPCALCQEHAELSARGFDPSKGWIGPPSIVPPQMPPSMFK